MPRKMIAIDEEEYRNLIKAKGRMEMESGKDLTLGQAIGIAATGVLIGLATAKLLEIINEEDD